MDRKSFLKKLPLWAAGQALALLDPKDDNDSKLKQRPPGSLEEDAFLEACTGCDACMAACPYDLILIEDLERRDPLIYPEKNPCLMCDGFPCIQSCPSGALSLPSEGEPKLRIL